MKIGVTGPIASGKGEVVKFFRKNNFKYISLSDMVREEAKKRNIPVTRENLQNIGNSLRKEFGAGVLGMKVREIIESFPEKNWIIDGIRNPAEIEELKKMKGFYLIGIIAPLNILIERILKREREDDPKKKEEIIERIRQDIGVNEPEDGQQVGKCIKMANFTIINEGSLLDLQEKLKRIYSTILKKSI
ncbi:MAG: AAA family ATPase [Acidobacteriota bacterium]